MEFFDLVNEQDEIIGTTTKEEAHTTGALHRVAAVYVFTPDGKLYWQEHLKSGGRYDHSVGGHVRKGESYDAAAKREAHEELGIKDKLQRVSIFYPSEIIRGKKGEHVFGVYEVTPSPAWKFVPSEEVKVIEPHTIEETVNLMQEHPEKFTRGFIRTMKHYLEIKKLPYTLKIS